MRRASFASIANVSLWETIRRSLATTFITLLPVLALLLFGGATLRDFAFALIVGITSGAYSSIFIAAPLLTIWKEREPEWARRKALGGGETKSSGRLLAEAEQAAARAPTPSTPMDVIEAGVSAAADSLDPDAKKERRRQRRQVEATWTPPVAAQGGGSRARPARTSDLAARAAVRRGSLAVRRRDRPLARGCPAARRGNPPQAPGAGAGDRSRDP